MDHRSFKLSAASLTGNFLVSIAALVCISTSSAQTGPRGQLLEASGARAREQRNDSELLRLDRIVTTARGHARRTILSNPGNERKESSCVSIGSLHSAVDQMLFELKTSSGSDSIKQAGILASEFEELADISKNLMTFCSSKSSNSRSYFDSEREADLEDAPLPLLAQTVRAETLLESIHLRLAQDQIESRPATKTLEAGTELTVPE